MTAPTCCPVCHAPAEDFRAVKLAAFLYSYNWSGPLIRQPFATLPAAAQRQWLVLAAAALEAIA